jgi:small-conductance mechanosensitive channel
MMLELTPTQTLAAAGALAFAGLAAGIAVRRVLFPRLAKAAASTSSRADDVIVTALGGPVVLWGLLVGLYAATSVLDLPRATGPLVRNALVVLVILSVTWTLSRLGAGLVQARTASSLGPLPSVNLLTNLVRITILLLGGLVILDTLGVSITPLLTAVGVGGLAVGLALQDTLANLFAGIHILLSRQVRPGDFIRLGSGQEGYVEDITWRYTTIRQLPNNMVIVPNSALATSSTLNFTLPDAEQAVLVQVGVSYASDLAQVERVTIEVGQEVMREVDGGVPSFTPFIRYHTFGDSSIGFTVILRGKDYVARYLVTHEFIKRLHRRYNAEGIEIPFPIRTVHLKTDQSTGEGTSGDMPRIAGA